MLGAFFPYRERGRLEEYHGASEEYDGLVSKIAKWGLSSFNVRYFASSIVPPVFVDKNTGVICQAHHKLLQDTAVLNIRVCHAVVY